VPACGSGAIPAFEYLGELTREVIEDRTLRVPLDEFSPGIHLLDDIFFRKTRDGGVEWVISRTCDHAGGKLILKNDTGDVICPMHGWQLDLETLQYRNVGVKKPRLEFEISDGVLKVEVHEYAVRLPQPSRASGPVAVRFVAHACVVIDVAGLRMITDPWLIGPCFNLGWWHAHPPKDDAIDLLKSADFVFVSLNHPDHCHLETLSLLSPDTPIIVPDFQSGSTRKILELTGHRQIIPLRHGHAYQVADTGLALSILNSGDFRDDSGLYLGHGDFQALLTVDSSYLNCNVLPRDVDLLMTSFAGAASGYPLCYDIYDDTRKSKLAASMRRTALSKLGDYVRATAPRAYVPYASFFDVAAERDRFIASNIHANSIAETFDMVRSVSPGTRCIDPLETDSVAFSGTAIETADVDRPPLYEVHSGYVEAYVGEYRSAFGEFTHADVEDYFAKCGYHERLRLLLVPTDGDFSPQGDAFDITFSELAPHVRVIDAADAMTRYEAHDADASNRVLLIRVRREGLGQIVANRMPWEDMLIGFQCRVSRKPDIYNSNFWYHFTNVYVGEEHRRASQRCDGCARIIQRVNALHEAAHP
jgi:CMP-N-acetylneuraminate monooxygenase